MTRTSTVPNRSTETSDPPEPDLQGKAVMILSLGSAQEFLAEARRTQDLWMGSFLLSYLMGRAIRQVRSRPGNGYLIIPDVQGQPLLDMLSGERVPFDRATVANLPNVLTCLVPAAEARSIGEKIEVELRLALTEITKGVFDAVHSVDQCRLLADADRVIWEGQATGLLDRLGLFWASCALPADGERIGALTGFLSHAHADEAKGVHAYAVAVQAAARAHAARKVIRDFPPAVGARPKGSLEKCTQCAQRVQVRPIFDDLPHFRGLGRQAGPRKVKLAGRIRKGDRLCAVCLIKRLAWEHYFLPKYGATMDLPNGYKQEDMHLLFPSSITIATAAVKERALDDWSSVAGQVEAFVNALHKAAAADGSAEDVLFPSAHIPRLVTVAGAHKSPSEALRRWLRLDGAWLFPEALAAGRIREESGTEVADLTAANDALKKLRARLDELRNPGSPPVSPYLALVAADGDHMGDWISGVRSAAGRDPDTAAARLTPEHQADLARVLKEFALEDAPRIVQDEHCGRLIYAGGDDVLAMMPPREALEVADALTQAFSRRLPTATLSAAVLVVHAREDLGWSVREAHRLLTEVAKRGAGRNALAVATYPRSGSGSMTVARWERGTSRFASALATMSELFRSGLSARILTDMASEEPGLSFWGPHAPVLKAEATRLIQRHTSAASSGVSGRAVVAFEQLLEILAETPATRDGTSPWARLVEALTVAQFIGRESAPREGTA